MANKSLVKKITTGSTTLVVCAFVIALLANYWHAVTQANKDHQNQLAEQLTLLSQGLESPLWSLDDNTIKLMGDAYMTGTDAVSLEIFTRQNKEAIYKKEKNIKEHVLYGRQDISHNNKIIGHVNIGISGASYAQALSRLLIYSLALGSFLVLSLALLMKKLLREHLGEPLAKLGVWTDSVAAGDYADAPPQIDLDELNSLASKFSNMSGKIKSRERSLQASERRFRGLFENTEVSIWNEDISEVFTTLEKLRQEGVKDLRQYLADNQQVVWEMVASVKVIQVNEATLELFGANSHEEMLDQIDKTFGANAIEVFIDELCAIWAGQKRFRAETSFRALNGKELTAIISFHIPETAEGFRSIPISIIDITEIKRIEEELARYRGQLESLVEEKTLELKKAQAELLQRERLVTLGKLTATVSHELRNPLGTIRTSLFSISDSLGRNEPQLAARSLELAERSISRCVNIIEELNDYTRVKGLESSVTALDDWLQAVIDDQVIPAGIRCELDLASGVEAEFDQEKLRRVMINLTTNAIHALQAATGKDKRLRISTRPGNGSYEIRVQDNGIGMNKETRERVFEPLYSTKSFGVGLGMVIVKNVVEKHHGEISIESAPGQGTTITLRLPINIPVT